MHRFFTAFMPALGTYLALLPGARPANAQGNYLYPDMFPYVEANAPASFQTLQAWQLTGTTLKYQTMFANQGDGLFEIRRGSPVSATRYELLQRVYINNDFGAQFVDLPIGTAPIPGTAGTPNPSDLNVIWFENFTKFSLLEAPIIDGHLTVGNEVAGTLKTSWRLSSNTGPLPGYAQNTPKYVSNDQTLQQRVSVGWADMYSAGTSGQFINIAGVPVGPQYWLRQTVDPNNRIHETDETNNSFEILIDLAHAPARRSCSPASSFNRAIGRPPRRAISTRTGRSTPMIGSPSRRAPRPAWRDWGVRTPTSWAISIWMECTPCTTWRCSDSTSMAPTGPAHSREFKTSRNHRPYSSAGGRCCCC